MYENNCALIWEPRFGGRIITLGRSLPECIENARSRHGITFIDRNQMSDRYSDNYRMTLEHMCSGSRSVASGVSLTNL